MWRARGLWGSLVVGRTTCRVLDESWRQAAARRRRGRACCYLDTDGMGDGKRGEQSTAGLAIGGDGRDGNGGLLSLLGARGLAGGHRKVHCCCSDEGGRKRGDSQLIGSPRLTAFPVTHPVIAGSRARAPFATTRRLIAPLGQRWVRICHLPHSAADRVAMMGGGCITDVAAVAVASCACLYSNNTQ